jgi:hypothetical protein
MVEKHEPARTSTAAERVAKHPEATPAAGGVQRIYQSTREFMDLHGCRWGRNTLVPVPDEDVEELLARGDIRIYEGPVFGDHLGEAVAPNAKPYAPYFGVKFLADREDVSKAPHKAS